MCVHVFVYIGPLYIWVFIKYFCACLCLCRGTWICSCMHTCAYVYKHVKSEMSLHSYVHIYVHMGKNVHTGVHVFLDTYMHACGFRSMCTNVHMWMHVYLCLRVAESPCQKPAFLIERIRASLSAWFRCSLCSDRFPMLSAFRSGLWSPLSDHSNRSHCLQWQRLPQTATAGKE